MRIAKRLNHTKKVNGLGWENKNWIGSELSESHFADVRLAERLRSLLGLLSNGIGQTIPFACQDWANTKAAYRFFSNPRVSEAQILSGHFAATQARAAALKEPLLVLHDTSEFLYQSKKQSVGLLTCLPFPTKRQQTLRGILMHSSLVLTTEGLPLGLAAVKFWTRKEFKGTSALKRKVNPTRIPIEEKESYRWLENLRQATALLDRPQQCVHIGDRESDIYELFCVAAVMDTRFLIRTCVDRLAQEGETTVAQVMKGVEVKGTHTIEVRDKKGKTSQAKLNIKYEKIHVRPPIGKKEICPSLELTVIHATETSKPRGRQRIEWKLITNLSVNTLKEALEKIQWYAMRWKIETYHKILKSGCQAESFKLHTSERLTRLIAVLCILGWRIFWMTMIQRTDGQTSFQAALTLQEKKILDKLFGLSSSNKLLEYLIRIARLGGYLARANDSPPGNMVMWRGLCRLTDIQMGFLLAKGNVGN